MERNLNISSVRMESIIADAEKMLGTNHCMGGTSAKCMDCSGLLLYSFKENGIALPHSCQDQARYGSLLIDRQELQRGDLLFFINSYNTNRLITHSGIYLGEDKFIHTSSKKGVSISTLESNPYWSEKFIFGTRVINQ